jgi:DNA-binding CsgD family transcriptional regulator
MGVAVEADCAQRARDLGDSERAARAVTEADLLLERCRAAAEEPGLPVERAWLATAEASASRAHGDSDPALWAAAAEAWDAVGRPYPATRARGREAEARLGRGDREAATAALRRARDDAGRLGSHWLVAEFDALAARGRLRADAGEDAVAAGASAEQAAAAAEPADPFGLTPRERQVLALVARGATNREIGAALYMAEKTASVHVSRILSKLDVRSRTQAAAVAHRLGLAAEPVA